MKSVAKEEFLDKTQSRKRNALLSASLIQELGKDKKAKRMFQCSSCLDWLHCAEDDFVKLKWANYCRDRMCPMCSARKAGKIDSELRQTAHHLHVEYPSYRYLVLTLTSPNIRAEELPANLTHYFESWKRLLQKPRIKKVVKGWFRALEITYNPETRTYHPHIHALLFVPSNYFTKYYIKADDWRNLWRESYRDPSITQLKIERLRIPSLTTAIDPQIVKKKLFEITSPVDHVVGEVAKYACKPSSYLSKDLSPETQLKVFKTMSEAVKGRRLYAFGLLMRGYHSRLKELNALEHEKNGTQPLAPCECDYCGNVMDSYTSLWTQSRYETLDATETFTKANESERKKEKSDDLQSNLFDSQIQNTSVPDSQACISSLQDSSLASKDSDLEQEIKLPF